MEPHSQRLSRWRHEDAYLKVGVDVVRLLVEDVRLEVAADGYFGERGRRQGAGQVHVRGRVSAHGSSSYQVSGSQTVGGRDNKAPPTIEVSTKTRERSDQYYQKRTMSVPVRIVTAECLVYGDVYRRVQKLIALSARATMYVTAVGVNFFVLRTTYYITRSLCCNDDVRLVCTECFEK